MNKEKTLQDFLKQYNIFDPDKTITENQIVNILRKISKNRLSLAGIDERDADYIIGYELNMSITDIPFSTQDLSKKQYNSITKKRCN